MFKNLDQAVCYLSSLKHVNVASGNVLVISNFSNRSKQIIKQALLKLDIPFDTDTVTIGDDEEVIFHGCDVYSEPGDSLRV